MKSVITIGREYGCGGREIAKALAEELHVPCYDRELILLAAETVVLVLLLVLRWKTPRTDTRETRTEYLQPNYNEVAGFRLAAYPDNEIIIPQRCWLIESEVAELDFVIVPGRAMSLRVARSGTMREPTNLTVNGYERTEEYEIDGLTVTQKQNTGRYTSISWTRDGFDYILYSQKPEMNMVSGLAVPFITNTRAEET